MNGQFTSCLAKRTIEWFFDHSSIKNICMYNYVHMHILYTGMNNIFMYCKYI